MVEGSKPLLANDPVFTALALLQRAALLSTAGLRNVFVSLFNANAVLMAEWSLEGGWVKTIHIVQNGGSATLSTTITGGYLSSTIN